MAKPFVKYRKDGYVCFTLDNRPEVECLMDEDRFEVVEFNTCWYIHQHVNSEKMYIRRHIKNECGTFVTQTLGNFILNGIESIHIHVFFKNENTLDCRKQNLSFNRNSK